MTMRWVATAVIALLAGCKDKTDSDKAKRPLARPTDECVVPDPDGVVASVEQGPIARALVDEAWIVTARRTWCANLRDTYVDLTLTPTKPGWPTHTTIELRINRDPAVDAQVAQKLIRDVLGRVLSVREIVLFRDLAGLDMLRMNFYLLPPGAPENTRVQVTLGSPQVRDPLYGDMRASSMIMTLGTGTAEVSTFQFIGAALLAQLDKFSPGAGACGVPAGAQHAEYFKLDKEIMFEKNSAGERAWCLIATGTFR